MYWKKLITTEYELSYNNNLVIFWHFASWRFNLSVTDILLNLQNDNLMKYSFQITAFSVGL